MREFLIHAERRDPATDAVVAFIAETLGIRMTWAARSDLADRPHLLLGPADDVAPGGIAIPPHPGDVLWIDLLKGRVDARTVGSVIPFDLIGAIGAFLRDEVHRDVEPAHLDAHGRLPYPASLPARASMGEVPVVNHYVRFLGELLRERLGIVGVPRWPEGRVAAIGLSHDVDHPDRYALLGSAVRPWRFRRAPRNYLLKSWGLARARLRDATPDDFWLFDAVAASERRHGFSSTFFFATTPFHGSWGTRFDVAYDIRGRRFRRVFGSLRDSGHEIGLHASYRAYETPDRLRQERDRLRAASGAPVAGVRHHYWHLGPDEPRTLRRHEEAGFSYDCSIAFNDHLGYRRSVALPFRPFDATLGRPLRTWQLPTFAMDASLLRPVEDVDATVEAVMRAVDRITETEGSGLINWHIQTSYPGNQEFRNWGLAYQAILEALAGRPEVWVTDAGTLHAWVQARAAGSAAGTSTGVSPASSTGEPR